MNTITATGHRLVTGAASTTSLRPRYEGCNIGSWIGFKHVNYLVEEAVLEHFRQAGASARTLYEAHGLGVDLVDLDTRILSALHVDDVAVAEVTPVTSPDEDALRYAVTLTVQRDGELVRAVTARVGVVLRTSGHRGEVQPLDEALAAYTVPGLSRARNTFDLSPAAAAAVQAAGRTTRRAERGETHDPVLDELSAGRNAIAWRWRMPYFYCHFTDRVQMSGYLRVMEEVVDLFLDERGVSIRTLLDAHDWIPVVPHSAIHLLDEAPMESDLYTVFSVEQVFKDLTYTAAMDCYVRRDGQLVQTARGRITHGYAVIQDRGDWRLVNFDDRLLRALKANG